ncbi:MAG: GspE/PulE family protein [Patescibacteria group bacterium]
MSQDLQSVVRNFDRQQEEQQVGAFAAQKGLPYINLVSYPFVGDILNLIPEEMAKTYQIAAFLRSGRTVRVASPDPFRAGLAEVMAKLGGELGVTFQPFICSLTSINYALERYQALVAKPKQEMELTKQQGVSQQQVIGSLQELKDAVSRVSTTELLETIISGALSLDASDVHFEPMAASVHVRFRIDGRLVPALELPEKTYKLLSSRIKTAAKIKLDIKHLAQDGRMTLPLGGAPFDIRVNAMPTSYGQTIELRLLSNHKFLQMDQLNFNPETLQAIIDAVRKPEGLVLFTGPTGSGKTTSLYAVLQLLNQPDKKIITLEDPVEYRLDGIEQVQIQPATEVQAQYSAEKEKQNQTRGSSTASFDFADALRSALRQDPDIIMVGEIRDKETAEIAVNAALTGHLVLSTLHTNSSSAAFARLIQMGVPKYLLADAVTLVVAQRLIRKLCDVCHGSKCDTCNQTGFRGRILISEHYVPDTQTVELIKREATLSEFEQHFTEIGNKTLLQDGLEKVTQGVTTEAEVRSVVG